MRKIGELFARDPGRRIIGPMREYILDGLRQIDIGLPNTRTPGMPLPAASTRCKEPSSEPVIEGSRDLGAAVRHDVGLALSGGGSRAAAFHRGTLQALDDLGLLPRIGVVSTVSGGSVFAAGWLAAVAKGRPLATFLESMKEILGRGFVRPALLSPRVFKVLLPGHGRTHRMAEVFDRLLTDGLRLMDLPARPLLCVNTTVLNHGQVGRFSRGGFSCRSIGRRDSTGSYPEFPAPSITLGLAAAASAAFPFGLPPLKVFPSDLSGAEFTAELAGHPHLLLTDGGVLENLGVQTLLRSGRFGARHLVVSDAGTEEKPFRPGGLWGRVTSFGAFALTPDILERLVSLMNAKESRSMRQLLAHEVGSVDPPDAGRRLLFVRIDQTWDRFLRGIPQRRRRQLAGNRLPILSPDAAANDVESFLVTCGVDLSRAKTIYASMGGDAAAAEANRVSTNFTGLSLTTLGLLARHAEWQLHAAHAVYGPLPTEIPPASGASTLGVAHNHVGPAR